MTEYLQSLLADPYNKFCVDCMKQESTHANITYGTFICGGCATVHH
jgi:Putative GTPase activating protein for Arf